MPFGIQTGRDEKRACEIVVVFHGKAKILVKEEEGRTGRQTKCKQNGETRTCDESDATSNDTAGNGRQNGEQRQRSVHPVEGEERESSDERLRQFFFSADAQLIRVHGLKGDAENLGSPFRDPLCSGGRIVLNSLLPVRGPLETRLADPFLEKET